MTRAFLVVKSKSNFCNCTTYTREFKLTFFASKNICHIVGITIQKSFKNVKSFFWLWFFKFSCIFNWFTCFTRTICALSHGLDLPFLFNWEKIALTNWSLRVLAFLKPIIGTYEKTFLWAWSNVSKSCNSSRIFLTFQKTG